MTDCYPLTEIVLDATLHHSQCGSCIFAYLFFKPCIHIAFQGGREDAFPRLQASGDDYGKSLEL